MNELVYNFLNQIEDVNREKEITIEEFIKLVRANEAISEEDGKKLIESFKKIASQKNEDDNNDSDQRKKKYRENQQDLKQELPKQYDMSLEENQIDDNSIER